MTGCEYLRGTGAADESSCGKQPIVATWSRDGASVRFCKQHDKQAQDRARRTPWVSEGWTREAA
mgnify:CR=1 FL=1